MLLLRQRTLVSEVKNNSVLIRAMEVGNLYATVAPSLILDNDYVKLLAAPMLLRSSLHNRVTKMS